MVLTFIKADVLKKLKALRDRHNDILAREHTKALAAYKAEHKAYTAKVQSYYTKVVSGSAEAVDYRQFGGLSKPADTAPTSTRYNSAIDLLELCTEKEIKVDTQRDKSGLGDIIMQALKLDRG